jgi:hypothetical protein
MKVFAFEVTSFNGHRRERNEFHRHFAPQQFLKGQVRFGSLADIRQSPIAGKVQFSLTDQALVTPTLLP